MTNAQYGGSRQLLMVYCDHFIEKFKGLIAAMFTCQKQG